MMVDPPRWNVEELKNAAAQAIGLFRKERLEEPLGEYLAAFGVYRGNVEKLFEATVDLTDLNAMASDVVANPQLLQVFRYLAGPPISDDDLKTVAQVTSLSPNGLRKDAQAVQRIIDVIRQEANSSLRSAPATLASPRSRLMKLRCQRLGQCGCQP
jgi:hypothetical protein